MKVEISKDVLFQVVDGEYVLLEVESGKYFGLNEVGSRIWSLLESGTSLEDTIDQLQAEYAVERDTLEADVNALLARLADAGLLALD
ncbi:MAG: PqqD family peptide modification chaperone [Xanthomonadales bacterium]|jgi:hypothetical protein|nr:PqqD family peptide modification chaperone [Xanthomonadales bacterium]